MKVYLCYRCGCDTGNKREKSLCRKCYLETNRGPNHHMWKGAGICPKCGGKKTAELSRKVCRDCWKKEPNTGKNHWNFGRHWSDEVKMKISKGNTGKRMGSENHKFNPEKKTRRTYRFPHRLWRTKVLDRDGKTCRVCFSKQSLNVNHINPYRNDPENLEIENGITLCESCHQITFGREHLFVNLFKDILKNGFNSAETSKETTPSQQEESRKVLWACVTVRSE